MSNQKHHKKSRSFARSPVAIEVSACLIVKNEEQHLSQCLGSLRSLADEIIVVDTGSSDRTISIAKKFQARVLHFEWCDDFAQARNYAISQAKGKWIFVIDADEVLEQRAIALLQEVMQQSDCLAVNLMRSEIGAKQAPYSLVLRLFRNLPEIAFTGIYHESIDQSVVALQAKEPHWRVLNVEVPVLRHYGYRDSEIQLRHKYEFAQRLMHKHLDEFPEDSYMLNKLGALYINHPDSDRYFGISLLQKSLSLMDDSEQQNLTRCEIYYHLGLAYQQNKDWELAKQAYTQVIDLDVPNLVKLSAYLNLGNIYQELNPQDAIAYFEKVTQIAPNFAQGHFNYGIALKTSGRFTEAIASYQRAISLEPTYADAHQNLGVVLMKVGYFPEAITSFTTAIQLHEQQQNYETAEILRSALQEFQ
ncbi:tetratricopeptide repeat protein [Pseudanabaena sp. FACHB-1998]|uniref:tetratricopeptide repeat protein n=1 Tax=Pseudanabaena sp. FACHB-1998 TaxID=2692858 RepID=UPI0016813F02|nr:tetratricopeptide repeat protein [Pseudanabaena sp. FACHB-1998]MBD2175600.1 tetratricopeptide repeat protein [Pseudanabaena sp. FACHB-1998]